MLICSERKINESNGKMMVTLDLFDKEWKPIFEVIPSGLEIPGKGDMKKPILFEEMKEIARKLSKDFDFVRVDLYQVGEKIYFGELTFCDDSGFGKFTEQEWDYKFGSYWKQKKLK